MKNFAIVVALFVVMGTACLSVFAFLDAHRRYTWSHQD